MRRDLSFEEISTVLDKMGNEFVRRGWHTYHTNDAIYVQEIGVFSPNVLIFDLHLLDVDPKFGIYESIQFEDGDRYITFYPSWFEFRGQSSLNGHFVYSTVSTTTFKGPFAHIVVPFFDLVKDLYRRVYNF